MVVMTVSLAAPISRKLATMACSSLECSGCGNLDYTSLVKNKIKRMRKFVTYVHAMSWSLERKVEWELNSKGKDIIVLGGCLVLGRNF